MSNLVMLRPFEKKRLDSLVELARDRFDTTLTTAEARVLLHSSAAHLLAQPPDTEPRPPVRPEFLRWLLTDPDTTKWIDPKGVRIWSVSIPTRLDLQSCTLAHPVHFLWSTIDELTFYAANLKGLFILGGTLSKGLTADGITVHGPIFIKGAKCDGTIRLVGSEINNIDLSGTELTGSGITLVLDGARVRGSAFLHSGFRSSGEVRMLNARIGGDLGFNSAVFTGTEKSLSLDKITVEGLVSLGEGFRSDGSVNLPAAQINGDLNCDGAQLLAEGISLNLATARINGHVYLRNGFKARGQLNMHSAEIGNSIDLSGATLTEAESAVFLQEATIRGTVSICDGFSSFGRVDVQSARIEGNLVCDGCRLAALYCANMTLKGDLQWTGIQNPKSTKLWLNGAVIKSLRDERESWPDRGKLSLDGLRYDELTLHSVRTEANRRNNELGQEHRLNIEDRVEWLRLQQSSDQAEPQPWMQLAALLKAKGEDDGAKRIVFELRRTKAKSNRLRALMVGFARLQQQPLWVLVSISLTTLLATSLFWFASALGAMAPTNKDAYVAWSTGSSMSAAYPRFNPFVYALENDLPLVKFGLDDKWAPDQTYRRHNPIVSYNTLRWARVILIFFGWFQATVFAAAIGSRFKN